MRSDQEIQAKATELLLATNTTKAPVEFEPLLESLGAEIRYESGGSDDVSGGLYRLPSGPIIGVNLDHSLARKRFTIAHEIGHLLLHDLPVFIDESFELPTDAALDKDQPNFRRDATSRLAVDPLEIEANKFAACLLMPAAFLKVDLSSLRPPLRADAVRNLARQYKVSQHAMILRLSNLNVPVDLA